MGDRQSVIGNGKRFDHKAKEGAPFFEKLPTSKGISPNASGDCFPFWVERTKGPSKNTPDLGEERVHTESPGRFEGD